jgi:hypothetical protein
MGRKARICIIVMLLSIIFMQLVPFQGDSCSASGPAIQLAQAKQTAYVTSTQDGMVTFTGTVFAHVPWTPESEDLVVELKTDAGGWCVIGPPSLRFTRAVKQKSFSVRVYVPAGTSASTQGQLSVSGRWRHLNTTLGGTLPPATAIICVEPYSLIDLDAPDSYITVEQGEKVNTYIEVRNMGNSEDRIRSEIGNREELENEGWDISIGSDTASIEEGGTCTIDLTMDPSNQLEPGIYDIMITANTSHYKDWGDPSFNYTLFIEVEEKEYLGIDKSFWMVMGVTLITLLGIMVSFQAMRKKNNKKWRPRPGIHGPGSKERYQFVYPGRSRVLAKFVQQSL